MKTESKTHGTDMYGPDAERHEQEFRTAQQQVKKTTLGQSQERERSVIINEYESDTTSRTKQFSQQ